MYAFIFESIVILYCWINSLGRLCSFFRRLYFSMCLFDFLISIYAKLKDKFNLMKFHTDSLEMIVTRFRFNPRNWYDSIYARQFTHVPHIKKHKSTVVLSTFKFSFLSSSFRFSSTKLKHWVFDFRATIFHTFSVLIMIMWMLFGNQQFVVRSLWTIEANWIVNGWCQVLCDVINMCVYGARSTIRLNETGSFQYVFYIPTRTYTHSVVVAVVVVVVAARMCNKLRAEQ